MKDMIIIAETDVVGEDPRPCEDPDRGLSKPVTKLDSTGYCW